MQIANCCAGPMTIAGKFTIPENGVRTFDDAEWAVLRERPAVKHWLESGKLKEVAAGVLSAPFAVTGTLIGEHSITSTADGLTETDAAAPPAPRRAKKA